MNEAHKKQLKQILDQIEFLDWRPSDYIDPEDYERDITKFFNEIQDSNNIKYKEIN